MLKRIRRIAARKILLPLLAVLAAAGCVCASVRYDFPVRIPAGWRDIALSQEASHPASETPDHIVLTPAGDMATGMRVAWRTAASVRDGVVQYEPRGGGNPAEARAAGKILHSPVLTSDADVMCFSAELGGLAPATTYRYRVGSAGAWSDWAAFTTASATAGGKGEEFAFVYFGDTQVYPDRFGKGLALVEERHPEAAFHMIGGDIVDRGDFRNLWDDFLANTGTAYANRPLAPTMGNHDYDKFDLGAEIFTRYFGMPDSGDRWIAANYSFRRGNAFFAVVSSLNVSANTGWLEKELARADSEGFLFKIVMFHVPVHHPRRHRSNPKAQSQWTPLFDKYGVDLVLTGHDHSYLRTKPLRGGKAAGAGEFGTTYVVATAGERFYPFEKLDVAELQLEGVNTYQLITLGVDGDGRRRLRYGAYDFDGKLLDGFETVRP